MLAELRITPVGSGKDLVQPVASVVELLERSQLDYAVHPMGTTLEGELDAILDVVRECHKELRKSAPRVLIELSLDDREAPRGELKRGLAHLRETVPGRPLERVR